MVGDHDPIVGGATAELSTAAPQLCVTTHIATTTVSLDEANTGRFETGGARPSHVLELPRDTATNHGGKMWSLWRYGM